MGTGEYFLAIMPDGTRLVQTISGAMRHPIPFGREAAAEMAGVPHRADWKSCQASIKQADPLSGVIDAQLLSRVKNVMDNYEESKTLNGDLLLCGPRRPNWQYLDNYILRKELYSNAL